MKLRTKYILFVGILHLVALVMSYFIFAENKILFIVSEAVILGSVVLSWQLYTEMIRPLKLLMRGTEAIKDQDFNVKFRATGKYEMDKLIEVYNHMIDELRTERTRQEQQHLFLEKLVFNSPTGILILDYDDSIQQVNPKALQLLGLEEEAVRGRSLDGITHPVLQAIRLLQSGQSKTVTFNGPATYKLQKSHFIDRGFPRHFVMIEELTAEILLAEKKTYGKVIRMMAHEVNNTIGPVNSILQSTLQSQLHSEMLTNALRVAMERNNNLELFMRNFADLVRIPAPERKTIDLARLVKNVTDLMQLRAGERKIVFRIGDPGPAGKENIVGLVDSDRPHAPFLIHADPQQMEQVLINIIKNAMEAIDGEGQISIILHRAYPKHLLIRDTGKGIIPEMEEHLFSPFYSTKKDGQGVGLTVIKEILLNHHFEFSLRTLSPGVTEFRIVLD
ncbi:MAG TPA: ATP-binding protein [Puia sp.]|nr:ATP-binding protein [Puia sp.]